jgi:hypothetical protein
MGTRALAEAVIMQSICDLWKPDQKRDSIKFFKGMWFDRYSFLAGMESSEKNRLIRILAGAAKAENLSKLESRREAAA